MRRALVVGLGLSGRAAALLLQRTGWAVRINDHAEETTLAAEAAELPSGVERVFGGHPAGVLEDVVLVVASPGVPWHLALLEDARTRGIEVIAEVELAARHLGSAKIAGITGSNGKTTTTALLGEICRTAGWRTGVGGNIGGAAACDLALAGDFDAVVLELSSFQLEGCSTLKPRVALFLNLSPDHLDRHAGIDAYLAAKARLFAAQDAGDWAIVNAEDPALTNLRPASQLTRFSLVDPTAEAHLAGATLVLDGAALLAREELPLLGDHNVANALAAALGAARLGVPRQAIAQALRRFQPLPHRHQLVAEGAGIRFVDDSKGTNIGATAAGLAGYPPGSIHLILGGLGKGQDFTGLRAAVSGRVACIYLIGRDAEDIGRELGGCAPIERCATLDEAVRRAAAQARTGDTVLLSPACASFDQFRSYAHRGDEFARIARATVGGDA